MSNSKSKENSTNTKGGYIFLSHSHDDIEKVRQIRNSLEKDGFEPLCFYLKCLNDDSEIEDLIKREIDAREWFVFVNSENARKSKWVTLEREYITSTNSKKIITVNIDNKDSITHALTIIKNNLRIFLLFSHKDFQIAKVINDRFQEKDYLASLVHLSFYNSHKDNDYLNFLASLNYNDYQKMTTLNRALFKASKNGRLLILLSKNSICNRQIKFIIEKAIDKCSNIIPVALGDIAIDDSWKYLLLDNTWYHLPSVPTYEDIDKMIDAISNEIISMN